MRVDSEDLAQLIHDRRNLEDRLGHCVAEAHKADVQWAEDLAIAKTRYDALRLAVGEAVGIDRDNIPGVPDEGLVMVIKDLARRAAASRSFSVDVPIGVRVDLPPPATRRITLLRNVSSTVSGTFAPAEGCPIHGVHPHDGHACEECPRCVLGWQPNNWAKVTDTDGARAVQVVRVEPDGQILVRHWDGAHQHYPASKLEPWGGETLQTRDQQPPVTGFNPNPEITWAAPDETAFPGSGNGGPPTESMPPVERTFVIGDPWPGDVFAVAVIGDMVNDVPQPSDEIWRRQPDGAWSDGAGMYLTWENLVVIENEQGHAGVVEVFDEAREQLQEGTAEDA